MSPEFGAKPGLFTGFAPKRPLSAAVAEARYCAGDVAGGCCVDIEARGPKGIPLEMRLFQIWKVRDSKVAGFRAFLNESEALEAAGLSD